MNIVENILASVAEERAIELRQKTEAAKAAADAILGPPKPPPAPPTDLFVALDERLREIAEAHAQAAADARKTYLDLLARMAPPRVEPPPAPDAHALAVVPGGGAPSPQEVLTILRAASRTPDDLRRDVRVLTTLRDQTDHASRLDELRAAEDSAEAALQAVRDDFAKVHAEWLVKAEVQQRLIREARAKRQAALDAVRELERAQQIDDDLRLIRSPVIPEPKRATHRELAAEQAASDARAKLHAAALRLGLLERVFFPPPPEPAPTTDRHEGWSVEYSRKDER